MQFRYTSVQPQTAGRCQCRGVGTTPSLRASTSVPWARAGPIPAFQLWSTWRGAAGKPHCTCVSRGKPSPGLISPGLLMMPQARFNTGLLTCPPWCRVRSWGRENPKPNLQRRHRFPTDSYPGARDYQTLQHISTETPVESPICSLTSVQNK